MMSIEDAVELVMQLARSNVIDERHAQSDAYFEEERKRQLEAIATVEDFFVNNIFN